LGSSASEGGVGVRGSAPTTGVEGFGAIGVLGDGGSKGGVFSSDKGAQINLVSKLHKLPAEAEAGDLIAINGPDKVGDQDVTAAELWFCWLGGDSENPAFWKGFFLAMSAKGANHRNAVFKEPLFRRRQ
jgi:hypothetical protein